MNDDPLLTCLASAAIAVFLECASVRAASQYTSAPVSRNPTYSPGFLSNGPLLAPWPLSSSHARSIASNLFARRIVMDSPHASPGFKSGNASSSTAGCCDVTPLSGSCPLICTYLIYMMSTQQSQCTANG